MARLFESVLVANRGEIAVRIIKTCRRLGIRTVAVFSDADSAALHLREADRAERIGPAMASQSYLNGPAIVEAARQSGAEAIHPGYGFLAENADFAEQCQAAGLVWIGPPPAAMRLLGDKAKAKALAQESGVATLPGYHGAAQDDAILGEQAHQVGFPLLVKAVAGGGGRGMRIVRTEADLQEALAAARREARAAFGDDRLLLERLLDRPRHVEMQIFGDLSGRYVYLGERDCSVQRRHQKVIEEAPAPDFGPAEREAMGAAAVTLARAAGYTNAGTFEFLLDEAGGRYFLEANTRLQVEHPVTEMVTGLDLVELQLRVAVGQPLPLDQVDVVLRGHAVEARLYAEDPSRGFLPSSGRLRRFQLPAGDGAARVDSGQVSGAEVSPYYDPLLAKIIAHGTQRQASLERLAGLLGEVVVEGIQTNADFLRSIVGHAQFGRGAVSTSFLRETGLDQELPDPPDNLLIAVAAHEILTAGQAASEPVDPWRSAGPWRPGWVGVELRYDYAGRLLRIGLDRPPGLLGPWRFLLPSRSVACEVVLLAGGAVGIDRGDGRITVQVRRDGAARIAQRGAVVARLRLSSGLGVDGSVSRGSAASGHDVIRAPLPGRIVKVLVGVGETVAQNQVLLVLEAMKIENLVHAPRDGIVKKVHHSVGEQVDRGDDLLELEEN
jgi:3-methylcrotonyl-CoA carboxylase alpha subunit